ncbi:hypothetical protein [Sorangium sp. So ce861]|uniref:hypothetical protein n=1 Tax=Sorangium sp. So ce861 TaxID=3133323 RepID=UPI003F617852
MSKGGHAGIAASSRAPEVSVSGGPEGDLLRGNAHPVESVRAHLTRGLSAAK